MDFQQYQKRILEKISKRTECEILPVGEGSVYRLVIKEEDLKKTTYFLDFIQIDGAGTLGIRIRWIVGRVKDDHLVAKNLHDNFKGCGINQGPLFASVCPHDGKSDLFALAGHLMFPPQTPAEEVATLFFNNAYLNYALFDMSFPGVELL